MSNTEFLNHLDEMMEQEPGTTQPGQALTDLARWDSMTWVQFIAFADEEFNVAVSGKKLMACLNVDDLAGLLQPHITG